MKSPVLLREGLSSSGAGAQLHKSLGSLCLGVLFMDRQFTAARSNEDDDGDMARDPSSLCFRGRFPADNMTSSSSDWQSIFSSKSRIQSSESLAMTDGSSPFMQSSPPSATVICAASSSMDSGVGEEYVRRAEVNPVTYETFKAIAQKQPEACGSATELSASTLPSVVAEQSSDVSVSSPLNSRVQMAARSSDEVDNVSDAESIFYAVRQYDDSSNQVLASPGRHIASLHRASPPHEELVLSRVKLMCSFGGEIMPRPSDGKLRYVGGETRIITVKRDISYVGFMLKMTEFYGMALTLKYQLPGEDLDALVSVFSDEDMQNMMEEYDKIEASDGSLWLRLFLFCVDHDVYTLGSIDQDCCNSPEKSYLDALNSVPEKGYRKYFENDMAREQQETDECARSVAQGGQTSRDALGHGQPPDAWTNFALQTFSRAPSPPSSPPLSSRQTEAKQLAVADASLQFFQDRLNRVSVRRHEASRQETSHQELEQSGSGCTSSTPQLEYQYQRESHRAPDSPRRTQFDIISHRAEHWRAGEAPGERSDFQLDPTWMSEHGTLNDPIDSLSEVQPSKVMLPLADLQQHVHFIQQQQQQQQILQQQQSPRQPPLDSWSTEFQNADPMQHSQPHTRTFLKFVPYPESHQSTAVKDRVPRQVEQPSFHMEDTLGANFFPSSSSHTLGTQRSYQIVSPSLSPRLVVHDPQGKLAVAQQHAQVQRILNGPTGDYYHGRMVQLPGDQSSRRYRVSTSSSHYRDNLMQSDEHSVWLLQQQQYQHNLGGSDIELQPWMESSLQHFYERDSASQTYFSAALSKQHLAQSGGLSSFLESLLPLNEKQEACVKGYEMIQEKENQAFPSQHLPFTSHVSRLDCHEQRSHTTEQASVHSAYSEVQEQPGQWVAHQRNQEENEARMCPSGRGLRRPASRNEELGKEFESGRCRESMGLSSSHHKEDFLSFVSFALGDREVPSHQGREWPESCIPLPTTFDSSLLLSSKVLATTNNALVSEGLQVSLPVTGRPSEIDQLSRLEVSKSASTRFESKHVTEVEPSVLPQEVGVIYAKQQSGVLRVVGDRTPEKDLDIWRGPSTAGLWNAVQYGLEGSSAEMSMYPGNLHHEHYSSGPDSFVKGMVGKGKRPAGEESNRLKSISRLTVASTRPSCVNGIHDERTPIEDLRIYISSNDGVGGGSCTSMSTSPAAPVSSPLSYHDTSVASHGWQDVTAATLNVGASDGLVNLSNLPIYDQSPSSSTNTTASRDFSLEPTEAEDSNCKEISAARMSVTGRLAEDMICSVLDSFSKEPLSKGNICVHASIHGKSADGNMLEETKGDREKVSGNVAETKIAAPSSESLAIVAGSFTQAAKDPSRGSGDREKVKEGILEEPSHSKERNHETVQICRENVAAAGNVKNEVKNSNGLSGSEAELEAYSHGLQTIKNADLEEMRELGSGTFGTVYHGKWRGSDVAIKRIKASCFAGSPSDQERLISDFWREAWTLGQLHHPNVVAFYGVVSDGPGGTLATVTEYMVNGSLKQVLQKKDRTIDRRKRLLIAMDAAFGMEYLHGKNIVHFDLKCENLLVNMRDPHRPICKVGDFGLSKVKRQTLVSGGVRGTLPWMAPELLNGKCSMVTEKVDVFSFGIVMWELLTGEEPYANIHSGAIIGGIVNNTLRPPIPSWCDPAWRSLMEKCWSGDPIERPPFSEVASDLRAIAASLNLK